MHQMTARGTEAHQHAVAGNEGHFVIRVIVEMGNVHFPTCQVLAVE